MAKQPSVNHLLERAVVKVLIGNVFKGTGFFISPDYLLTAYHCLGDLVDEENIFVENQTYERMRVILDRNKSFPSQEIDIAVLKLVSVKIINDYLPLGLVTENHLNDEILVAGYPLGGWQSPRGDIRGFSKEHPQQFFTNAMVAEGQSGGAVYHCKMNRIVGIALNLHRRSRDGLAGRFDVLFRQWQELGVLNQQAMTRWDNLVGEIKSDSTTKPTHFDNRVIISGGVQGNVINIDSLSGDLVLGDKISGNKTVHK